MSNSIWRRQFPGQDASDLEMLLFKQDGVITRQQALRHFSKAAVDHKLNSGRWQSPVRSLYLVHTGSVTRSQRNWLAVLGSDAGQESPLAGVSALESHGLRGYSSWTIHVLVPASCQVRVRQAGVKVHRTTLFFPDHVMVGTPPRTIPARAVVDAAAWSRNDDDARALIAAAFQQRLVTVDDVLCAVSRMRRSRRRALVIETSLDASGGSHSIAELDFVSLCRRFGLPKPSRQEMRTDAEGRARFLDGFFEEYAVVVEIDGSQHLDPRAWWEDMRRQNNLWIKGDRILRFPAWLVRTSPEEVAKQIKRALEAAGWRRPNGSW